MDSVRLSKEKLAAELICGVARLLTGARALWRGTAPSAEPSFRNAVYNRALRARLKVSQDLGHPHAPVDDDDVDREVHAFHPEAARIIAKDKEHARISGDLSLPESPLFLSAFSVTTAALNLARAFFADILSAGAVCFRMTTVFVTGAASAAGRN